MDAPKGLGALGSQRKIILIAVAAVALPLSVFIYLDASTKSRALNEIEANLVKAEQAVEQKDYIKARDFLDRGSASHLSLKFRNSRWEDLAERIKGIEGRIGSEEAPFTYKQFLKQAREKLLAGEYAKAEEALKNAKDTASLNGLYKAPFNLTPDEFNEVSASVETALKRARLKVLSREAAEAKEKSLFSETWELVREADALGLKDEEGGDEEFRKAKAEMDRVSGELKSLIREKKDQGFILLENKWVPIKDHALNRLSYMRAYAIEVEAPEADAAVIGDTIARVFQVIVPGLSVVSASAGQSGDDSKQPDLIVRVDNVSAETGPGGSFTSAGVFELYEPRQDVNIWRLSAHVNSETYRGPSEPGDPRTDALKSLVKDVFYKDFFKDLPGELRKKTNADFAGYQR